MSKKLPAALADLSRNAVMPLGALRSDELRDWAQSEGHRFAEILLADCADRKAALKVVGKGLGFPRWFGANLDALYDSLTDLAPPLAGKGLLLTLPDLSRASGLSAEDREALLDVFRDATEAFAGEGVALRVLFD